MIMVERVIAHQANCKNKHKLKTEHVKLLRVKDKSSLVLTAKIAQAHQVCLGKANKHKPVQNASAHRQTRPVATPKAAVVKSHRTLKIVVLEIVKVPLLVALDVANNERMSRNHYEHIV